MQRHWKAILGAAVLAMAAFIAAIMSGNLMYTYVVVVSAFVMTSAYMVAVARFQGRQDPEDEPKHSPGGH
jgi:hypothetical protein